ncbi:MAG TPA: phosphopantetheine-binding protein [Candidatus Limnocylindrales bacterium]|nr:phosphopantetheine-binding protein [Candidatus Limnocylindrales bacterium]
MAESQTDTGSTVALQAILHNVMDQVPADHEIAPEQRLMNLGVTSLQLMQIVAALEQELDIEFPDSALDLATFETFGSLAAVVESLTGDRSETLPG